MNYNLNINIDKESKEKENEEEEEEIEEEEEENEIKNNNLKKTQSNSEKVVNKKFEINNEINTSNKSNFKGNNDSSPSFLYFFFILNHFIIRLEKI